MFVKFGVNASGGHCFKIFNALLQFKTDLGGGGKNAIIFKKKYVRII